MFDVHGTAPVCVLKWALYSLQWPEQWLTILRFAQEFHQIYNFRAIRDIDELVRFWGERSSVLSTMTRTKIGVEFN